MRKVALKDLKAGMALSRNVESGDGYRVLGKGTVLTDTQIALLRGWDIIDVLVEDETHAQAEPEGTEDKADTTFEEDRRRLKSRFEGCIVNVWMKTLLAEAEKRLEVERSWQRRS